MTSRLQHEPIRTTAGGGISPALFLTDCTHVPVFLERREQTRGIIGNTNVARDRNKSVANSLRGRILAVIGIGLAAALVCALPLPAQNQKLPAAGAPTQVPSNPSSATEPQNSDQQATGMIAGNIVDQSSTPVFGAKVILNTNGRSPLQTAETDQDGHYSFANISSGPFQITVSATGFEPQTISGSLDPGEYETVGQIKLVLSVVVTQIVVKPQSVIAQEQLHVEEQQRVLAVFPNFYVSYLPNAVPLNTRQKFQLAWKSVIDPVTFFVVGANAGLEEADGQYTGFDGGVAGYAERYGASFGDIGIGTFLSNAVFPSIFRQDPRFFYKSTGSVRARLLYALAAAVICKGDNGHWQPNYSVFAGDLASGAISNLYYPPQDRNGVALTFESAAIGIGADAAANIVQEFLIPKLNVKSPFSGHRQHHQNQP